MLAWLHLAVWGFEITRKERERQKVLQLCMQPRKSIDFRQFRHLDYRTTWNEEKSMTMKFSKQTIEFNNN